MIIGIDLGTTNSLAAYFTEEGPKIIPNRLGKNLTPSIVSVDEQGQIYVGETARELLVLEPMNSASVFKRNMGSDKKYQLGMKTFTAEELSSFVLRSLKEDAEAFLGEPVTEAIISVPAYFNDARRKATKRAGELAGLKVERIISEPTAAAIAYGLYQKNKNTKFLVFDLGGGTFDVSILELFHTILEVRAVAGDNFLGGEDFTEVLEQMFFTAKEINKDELDQKTRNSIRQQAEKCKIAFSQQRTSTMSCNINGVSYDYEIEISEYEEACQLLLERIRQPIKRSLADANIKLSEIDMVVLVGGATKLPIVRKFVGKLFKKLPDTSVNPDEVVALGAAIQGAMKERKEAIKEVILTDVCPFTLGTEVVVEREGNRFEEGHFCPIIERNTVIPASRTERLYTVRDNQTKIRVNILQGESRFAVNNLPLGELQIDVPKAPAGQEAVDVTYTYDMNSILEVEVTVISTGKKVRRIIKGQNSDMTEEEIEKRMEELSYLKIHPRDQEENKLLLLRGERLYEESVGRARIQLEHEIRKFEDALSTREKSRITGARRELKDFLDELEELN
ncbi:molecular chaperone HscC [Anaeromicropila populeti]|uniref:Chaperone protein DnaK n=1 Tax=Anaeromicropila populeti TaxID=37658 RepID=A0A1I6HN66_9FIRM|nr:molecular chaperone HscC [Anaeromicropila populeti]SFR55777.1 molecular chaperone HscC [Anaeromicropila populeti]